MVQNTRKNGLNNSPRIIKTGIELEIPPAVKKKGKPKLKPGITNSYFQLMIHLLLVKGYRKVKIS